MLLALHYSMAPSDDPMHALPILTDQNQKEAFRCPLASLRYPLLRSLNPTI